MAPLAAVDNDRLDALIEDLRMKESSFTAASAQNDTDQAAAQASIATAASSAMVKTRAHDDLTASIDALIEFLNSLR